MATIKRSKPVQRVQPARKPATPSPVPKQEDAAEEDSADAQLDTDEESADDETAEADDTDGEGTDDIEEDAEEDQLDDADDAAAAQAAADAAEAEAAATQQPPKAKTPASGAGKPPAQAGFAQRVGRTSTKPVKPATMARPYLDSPRDFGIHIEGHLVRFKKGRTSIHDGNPAWKNHALSVEQVLHALRTDSYVADNGAELVE